MKNAVLLLTLAAASLSLFLTGCKSNPADMTETEGTGTEAQSYRQITQQTAKEMMAQNDGHIVVDVRRQDEFDSGHIPGAICIPNESIDKEKPAELPDLDQIILICCRSGRRSKEASQKLADMGYKNVYEFGGIIDWTGETVTEKGDESEMMTENRAVLVIQTENKTFYASLEDNPSAKEFAEKLSPAPIELDMRDYGGFEKVAELPWEIVSSDTQITTQPGDIVLYNGNQITVYYGENSWELTLLARIGNTSKEELINELGEGDVKISMHLEWDE